METLEIYVPLSFGDGDSTYIIKLIISILLQCIVKLYKYINFTQHYLCLYSTLSLARHFSS